MPPDPRQRQRDRLGTQSVNRRDHNFEKRHLRRGPVRGELLLPQHPLPCLGVHEVLVHGLLVRPPGVVLAEENVEFLARIVIQRGAHGPDEAEQKRELDDGDVRLGLILEVWVEARVDAVLGILVRVEQRAELPDGCEPVGIHSLLELQPAVLEALFHVLLEHSRQRLRQDGVLGVLRLLKPGLDEGPPAEIFGVQVDHTRARYRRR